jgi:hypothetical protein
MAADEAFERLTRRFISEPAVSQGTGFGSSPGLRVRGRIFAMLSGDALVVKLPKDRVDQLVASGNGIRFDPGHGRVMRGWISVPPNKSDEWESLAAESFAFVEGRS